MQKEIKRFNKNFDMYFLGLVLIVVVFVGAYVVQETKQEEIRSERVVIER